LYLNALQSTESGSVVVTSVFLRCFEGSKRSLKIF